MNSQYIALSMLIIWPLPWLLSTRAARQAMGFSSPDEKRWFLLGPLLAVVALGFCVGLAWGIYGNGSANWFSQHALAMQETLRRVPAGVSIMARFWIVTLPALIFSPLAEEFLYRGFIMTSFTQKWGSRTGMGLQALAFALVHLAHYGLNPLQPALIGVWIPSMFVVALVFGWIVKKSGSLWIAVLSHSVFNFGMNAVVFVLFPNVFGA